MSNHLAIATVTAALRRGLLAAVLADVAGSQVTHVRPDRPGVGGSPQRGVNLFLYQVSQNAALRTDDLPTRDGTGRLRQRPRVALNLDYLFSFYGDDSLLESQRLLGTTLRFLHARPQLTRAQIEAAVADSTTPFLAGSNLADQVGPVTFSPISLSLEDLSRVWSIFIQVPYVLSAAYRAGVVIVEPTFAPAPALPVRAFHAVAIPFRRAVIERVEADGRAGVPAEVDTTLFIRGHGVSGGRAAVVINGYQVRPGADDVSEGGVRVSLTRVPLTTLRPGIGTVKIVRDLDLGEPPAPHRVLESNLAALTLRPLVADLQASVTELRVQVAPPVGDRQLALLLLDAVDESRSFSLSPIGDGITEPVSVSASAAGPDPAVTELGLSGGTPRRLLISAPRPGFSGFTQSGPQLGIAVDGGDVQTIGIAGGPATLAAAAAALETAIRAAGGPAALTAARVFVDGDRVVVMPGAASAEIRVGRVGADPSADEIGLRGGLAVTALLGTDIGAFAGLTNDPARVALTIDTLRAEAAVAGGPTTVAAAATALCDAMRAASTDDLFTSGTVLVVDNRLLVIHGRRELRFSRGGVPGGTYLVRLQVNGIASELRSDATGRYAEPAVALA